MSTRLPPTAPRSGVLARLQRAPLRSIVLITTLCGIAWGLAFGVQSFQDLGYDRSNGGGSLVTFDIVIGALFIAFAVDFAFGFAASALNRALLAKIFAYLAVLGAILVCAGHLFIIIAHFHFHSQIVSECLTVVSNSSFISGSPFWFGYTEFNLTTSEAQSYCSDAFSHASFTSIVYFLAAMVLSLLSVAIALAWSYQIQDPSYGRRQRTEQISMGAFRPDGRRRYDPPPEEDRMDAFVPPYDANMPPKYVEGDVPPVEKDGLYESAPGYSRHNNEWSTSEGDLHAKPLHEQEQSRDVV